MIATGDRVLDLVEDDPILGLSLVQRLALEGIETRWWRSGAEALAAWERSPPDLVVCDVRLPDLDGEELFSRALLGFGRRPFLFITGHGEIVQAVRLVRMGALDYLTKPFAVDELVGRVQSLLGETEGVTGVLGGSAAMRRVEGLLLRITAIDSHVLVTGESGVGKEVAARFLHDRSARGAGPFMAVNCAAIPAELIESEIFGSERGAFTGAQTRHLGYAERAGGGTLFLDEVGDLPLPAQGKLLRLIQEPTFFRLGGEKPVAFAARIVCATNRDLAGMVAEGRFREDLYYRINVIPVAVPPLRERPDDVLPLLRAFIRHFAGAFGREIDGLTAAGEEMALGHRWAGNVRELRNRAERAVALADGRWILPLDLFPEAALVVERGDASIATLAEARDATERLQIERALLHTGHRMQETAQLLGVSRTTLWEKMRRLRIGDAACPENRTS